MGWELPRKDWNAQKTSFRLKLDYDAARATARNPVPAPVAASPLRVASAEMLVFDEPWSEDAWKARWRAKYEDLAKRALPMLGKVPGGRKGESDALQGIGQIAQRYDHLLRDRGRLGDVRESLNNIAAAAGTLADHLDKAKPGVYEALAGGREAPEWADLLRIAAPLSQSSVLILQEDGSLEEDAPGLKERVRALAKAADRARTALLLDARNGGNRDWETYRGDTASLELMRECLLLLVTRGLGWERKLRMLARAIAWVVEEGEEPALGWGQPEYDRIKAWWKVVGPYNEIENGEWPDEIRTLYLRGPSALKK